MSNIFARRLAFVARVAAISALLADSAFVPRCLAAEPGELTVLENLAMAMHFHDLGLPRVSDLYRGQAAVQEHRDALETALALAESFERDVLVQAVRGALVVHERSLATLCLDLAPSFEPDDSDAVAA